MQRRFGDVTVEARCAVWGRSTSVGVPGRGDGGCVSREDAPIRRHDAADAPAAPGRVPADGADTVGDMADRTKPTVTIPDDAPPAELLIEDEIVGEGPEVRAGATVLVHYVGVAWSTKRQFDASWDRGDTFDFRLGAGQVIAGWDQGVAGMKVGGRRRLTIPPHLGYGSRGAGGVIKGGETLVFVVDLVGAN